MQIWRNEHIRPSKDEVQKIETFLVSHISKDNLYDDFGFNKIISALQSINLAVTEIGLRGKVLTASVLLCVIDSEDEAIGLRHLFGDEVVNALIAFLRVTALLDVKLEAMKTENFRNLFVSSARDMRVVLFQIARCVNLMRRVRDTENLEAKKKLSVEAAYLYAPLAHKLGLYKLKSELEDLSLKYLEHDAYYMIKDELNATKKSRDAYIERFIAPIRKMLDKEGLRYHMKGRTKSIHSIWQKMKKQQCGFNGVYDLFAIRIILDAPLAKERNSAGKYSL